ncbi:hypothetical protein NW762_014569 [Fusarium torreyae]|uniref:Trichothecene 3-O-acetyltransferase n=1 Tax=Fusarium torreyae TaxID=1237075 RepID=A0A9W8RLG3_9HYPO|nr:hypothetical protein NW762_014569 [Fusarium torreyae]
MTPTTISSELPDRSIFSTHLSASPAAVIKPHPDSHGDVVKLSAIDQIAPRDYISTCLFFRHAADLDKEHILSALIEALSRTVADIPELACCVQKRVDNSREEVELLFDSTRGVEIYYKDYTSPELSNMWLYGSFDQLERQHFPVNKMPRHLVFGPPAVLVDHARIPSLIVQISFLPGGLILGSRLHHVAGDGQCNYMLHTTIGAHLASITDGSVGSGIPSIQFPQRHNIVDGDPNVSVEELPHWKLTDGQGDFLSPTTYKAYEKFDHATYFISSEKLDLLKSRILKALAPSTKSGKVEALCAFIWHHIVLARNIDPQQYPEAKLAITVNARSCMKDLAVPSNYWGNFAEPNAVAKLPVADLQHCSSLRSSSLPANNIYYEAARQIQKAITAVDDKAVRRLVGLLNQMPKSTTLTWNANRYPGPDMLIVCIQGHKYNDINFGSDLGHPVAMRATVGDTEGKPDGRCLIMPPRRGDGKGLEISLQYDDKTLERLEDNVEFSDYFVRRN